MPFKSPIEFLHSRGNFTLSISSTSASASTAFKFETIFLVDTNTGVVVVGGYSSAVPSSLATPLTFETTFKFEQTSLGSVMFEITFSFETIFL